MQFKRKQKFLVPSTQIVYSKEIKQSRTQFQQYGWRNVSTIFKTIMLSYLIEFIKEELDTEVDDDNKVYKKHYGITRIPDAMAMVEMENYNPGVNVDRIVALASLISFVKIQEGSRGLKIKTEYDNEEHLDNSKNLFKLSMNPFRHIGKNNNLLNNKIKKSPFKHIK